MRTNRQRNMNIQRTRGKKRFKTRQETLRDKQRMNTTSEMTDTGKQTNRKINRETVFKTRKPRKTHDKYMRANRNDTANAREPNAFGCV